MIHPVYKVTQAEVVSPYTLRVEFDDHTVQVIDFQDVLVGEMYGPLRDARLFEQVKIDPEVHTLVWPNGAHFDPATLHDWPQHTGAMQRMAQRWAAEKADTHR